jgi:hypothetical protein
MLQKGNLRAQPYGQLEKNIIIIFIDTYRFPMSAGNNASELWVSYQQCHVFWWYK